MAGQDFVNLYAQQRATERIRNGTFEVPVSGGQAILYPRLGGTMAVKIAEFWLNEAARLSKDLSSHADAYRWNAAVARLRADLNVFRSTWLSYGDRWIPNSNAQRLWDLTNDVKLPMGGLNAVPSAWSVAVVSIKEAAGELATFGGNVAWTIIKPLVLPAVLVVGGYFAYKHFIKERK